MLQTKLIVFLLLYTLAGHGQTYEYTYRDKQDSTINCYLTYLPANLPVKGLIVRDYSSLPDTSKKSIYKLHDLAAALGIMTLYTVTSKQFPALYYDDSGPALLDDIIHEVVVRYKIPEQNIFIGGISASGTRALRFARYCAQKKSVHGTRIKGVFAVDPPLDLERFYISARQNISHFKGGMLDEAKLILEAFPKYIGTPETHPERYREASVYSYTGTAMQNITCFREIPIILFHEPDIDWWIHERGAGYFDINSFDIAGFVNALITAGCTQVELVTTTGKGYDRQGKRNCHSWTIVDEHYLIRWMADRID